MALKQIVVISASTSIIGGGIATGTYFLLQDNSINKQLLKENKKILDINADVVYWEIKLSSYTREKSSNDLALTKDDIVNLKKWCTKTLNSKFSSKEDKNYKSAKSLCTVPSNKEKLLKENKTILDANGDWTSKETAYKRQDNQSLISTITNREEATVKKIKSWCNENIENEYDKDNLNNYNLTLKWCTQQGS